MGKASVLSGVSDVSDTGQNSFDWSVVIILVIIALVALVLFLVINFIVSYRKDANFNKTLKAENNTVRIYKIDQGKGLLTQFDLSDISKKKSMPIESFYSTFPIGEQSKVREWVEAILDGKNTENILETDIVYSSSKRIAKSFLYLTKADPRNGTVYLESHPLPSFSKKTTFSFPKSSEEDFSIRLRSSSGTRGYTFCFLVYPIGKNNKANGRDNRSRRDMPKGTASRFISAISAFAVSDQMMIQSSGNEIILSSFTIDDITQAMSFGLRTAHGTKELMNRNRRRNEPLYDVKCGFVAHRLFPSDPDAILAEARHTAYDAFEEKGAILEYKKGQYHVNESVISKNKGEIERIINERKLKFMFRPVYSLEKKRVVAFLSDAVPINSSFTNLIELKNYAARAKEENNLFAALGKNIVPRFLQERPLKSQKIFYPVRVNEIKLITAFFPRMRNIKDAHVVFTFTDSDIVNSLNSMTLDELLAGFHDIRMSGFDVAVSVSGNSLVLQQPILRQMSAFIVDFSSSSDEEQLDTRIRSQLHSLVEKLLKYRKPIIASSLKNWNSIELVIGSGITYISSDVFAPYSEMLTPIGEKVEKRLLSFFR